MTYQVFVLLGLYEVGGYEPMSNQYMGAAANYTYYDVSLFGNRTCGFPPEDSFHIFRPADDGSYPWPGMVFGLTILATNAWCTDQVRAVIRTLRSHHGASYVS